MDAPGRPLGEPPPTSSGPVCPGCGRAVDALRAGHVSVTDAGFVYFHDASCKAAFGGTSSRQVLLEALTKDPPAVASGTRPRELREPPPPPAPVRDEPAPTHEDGPVETLRVTFGETSGKLTAPAIAWSAEPAPLGPQLGLVAEPTSAPPPSSGASSSDVPPATLRSPALGMRPVLAVSPQASPTSRFRSLASPLGITVGLLAAVVALGGEALVALRPSFALLSAVLAALRVGILPRRGPAPVVQTATFAPVGVAAFVMVVAPLVPGAPRAGAAAVFVGLASATLLAVDLLVLRARRSVDEERDRVRSALDVTAKLAHRRDGREAQGSDVVEEVAAGHLKPGDAFIVTAKDVMAADGVVTAGSAEVAPWTGSGVVSDKREGDHVVAGATVLSGRLRVSATFTGPDRAWARLVDAAAVRADVSSPLLVLARRVASRGAPAVAAVAAAATWASNGSVLDAILAGCAGAFVLGVDAGIAAAALALARAQVAAAARGIVYKDAGRFELASRADVAVVCSRGTLLLGEPEIVAVEAVATNVTGGDDRVLALAAGAELGSSHPFAAAILRAARSRNVSPEPVRSAIGHSGLGVSALVASGEKVVVGSRAFLLSEKVSVALADARVTELEGQGRSVLVVALAGRLVGLLALQDGLRPGARAAVQRLHDAHVEPVLLSGEARDTCETIARALEIEHVRPEVLPADRGAEVAALAEGGHVVAAIGHPSSDDGALGAADLAVAMASAGAPPGEWGVSLASDDVRDAALALAIPRAGRDRARFALGSSAVAQGLVALALAFGAVPPWAVAAAGLGIALGTLALVREGADR